MTRVVGDSQSVELKVAGNTDPNKLGSAIVRYLKEVPFVYLTAMGDAAVNKAVKSMIVAQSFAAYETNTLDVKFGFENKFDEKLDKEITLIVFYITMKTRFNIS